MLLNRLTKNLFQNLNCLKIFELVPVRNVIYYDRNTSNRHTCPEVLKRYYRLHWGGWIRKKAGSKRHLWRKPWNIRWYGRQHIFAKEEECKQLEALVTPKYKKVRHFVDDIYNPYHERHNFDICPAGKDFVEYSYLQMLYKY